MSARKSISILVGAVVCVAVLSMSACGTVDLGPVYSPPPIQTPQSTPEPMPPSDGGAQSHPVQDVQIEPLPPIDRSDPDGHLVTLTTRLDAHAVVPAVPSAGMGQFDALYNRDSRVLRWKASWSELSGRVVGVAFHGPARAGANAPIVISWPGPFGPRYEGRATLTPDLEREMLNGLWYVTVFTDAFPQGEIRGQLRAVR